MTHNHASEFQIRIVHEDGTEEFSGWMNGVEQLAQAMAVVHRAQGRTYWLQQRTALCPICFNQEQIVEECLISDAPSVRYRPHDSRYLLAVGSRSRYELLDVAIGGRR